MRRFQKFQKKKEEDDSLDSFMKGIQEQIDSQPEPKAPKRRRNKDVKSMLDGLEPPLKIISVVDTFDIKNQRIFGDEEEHDYVPKTDEGETYFDLVKKVGNKKELPEVDHSRIEYCEIHKNFYVQVREISLLKDHEVEAIRKANGNIRVGGKGCPKPIKSFYQCGLSDRLLKVLERREYEIPFPIQMQAIPAMMAGRDIIGIAETGSGKTLAYLLPMIRHVLHQPPLNNGDGPIGMVIAPTRELTTQIYRESALFCKIEGLKTGAVYGGIGIGEQLSMLKRGVHIVIATPGRLIDVLTISGGKVTNLRRVSMAVLDEADRMFDMGFEPQINAVLNNIRPDRQCAMFSATFPPHIEALARRALTKPLEIVVGERGASSTNVQQFVEIRPPMEKFYRLLQLLGEWYEHGHIIIFVAKQTEADDLFIELAKHSYEAIVLHGGLEQDDRQFTIEDFRSGAKTILIATSVAARGLDVKEVVLVINYTCPDHLEDYVHRVGRTARGGGIGVSYTFLDPEDGDKSGDVIKALTQTGQEVPSDLKDMNEDFRKRCNMGAAIAHRGKGFRGRGFTFGRNELSRTQQEKTQAKRELGLGEEILEAELPPDPLKKHHETPEGPVDAKLPPTLKSNIGFTDFNPNAGRTSAVPASAAEIEMKAEELARVATNNISELSQRLQKKLVLRNSLRSAFGQSPTSVNAARSAIDVLGAQHPAIIALGPGPKGAQAAQQALARIVERGGQTVHSLPRGAPVAGLGPSGYLDAASGNCVDEFDINEYPQLARMRAASRESLNRIAESTGGTLQVRGTYVSPDQRASGTIAKGLYVEISGPTAICVQRAKHELRMFMEISAMRQLNTPVRGKYSVV